MATCAGCGNFVEPDAAFCPYCGRAMPGAAIGLPTARRASHLKRNIAILLIIAIVAIAGLAILYGSSALAPKHSQVIATGYAVIPEGYFNNATFTIPAGASNAVVTGTFTASGDLNNQITVLIMSQGDFFAWQSGAQYATYYDSGPVTGATVNVPLPAGNTYDVVFYNTFTGAASTVVTGQLTLTYSG